MKNSWALCFLVLIFLSCGKKKNSMNESPTDTLKSAETKKDSPAIILEQSSLDSIKGSIKAEAVSKIGDAEIKISYYSPAVRERIIWGGLVPFDKVWVTGAHSATSIEFSKDVVIGGKLVAAGKYALFTIPGKSEWTLIINKNWRQHLTDRYDEQEDIVRVKVKPETEDSHQERLRYVIEIDSNTEGEIVIYWEKLDISLPFSLK